MLKLFEKLPKSHAGESAQVDVDLNALTQFNRQRPRRLRGPLSKFILDIIDQTSPTPVSFVQVGANDGQLADRIFPFIEKSHWHGLLIEPHPIYFNELKELHAERPDLVLRNIAISDTEGEFELFHLNEAARARFPKGLRGCASLNRSRMQEALDRVEKNRGVELADDDIASTMIKAIRLDSILKKENISQSDVVVIDTEGHELPVLRSFDLDALRPKLAIIECNGSNKGDEAEIVSILRGAGLQTYRFGEDLFGLRPDEIQMPFSAMLHFLDIPPL